MAAEHTPGPWTVETEEHRAPHDWFAANVYSGEPTNGTYRSVARIPSPQPHWSDEKRAEVEADARLIAASPDLLAALERIVSLADGHRGDAGDGVMCLTCRTVRIALEAIRAARGEASRGN